MLRLKLKSVKQKMVSVQTSQKVLVEALEEIKMDFPAAHSISKITLQS